MACKDLAATSLAPCNQCRLTHSCMYVFCPLISLGCAWLSPKPVIIRCAIQCKEKDDLSICARLYSRLTGRGRRRRRGRGRRSRKEVADEAEEAEEARGGDEERQKHPIQRDNYVHTLIHYDAPPHFRYWCPARLKLASGVHLAVVAPTIEL